VVAASCVDGNGYATFTRMTEGGVASWSLKCKGPSGTYHRDHYVPVGLLPLADGSVLAVGSSTAVSGGTAQAMVLRVSSGGSLLFLKTILPVAKARTLTGIVPAGSDWIVSGHAVENDLYSAELLRLTPAPAKAGVEWAA
jgi:hypothetical protein